jgi:iron-sulfur cluster repair protein YtfE (RIC family)
MRRHASLITLTHDHHHGLSHARKLKLAGQSDDASERLEAARSFLAFFENDTLVHFREEEEILFPVFLEHAGEPPEELIEVLVQHVRIHGLVAALRHEVGRGEVRGESLGAIGETLEGHIRLEERKLFPIIERTVPDDAMRTLEFAPRERSPAHTAAGPEDTRPEDDEITPA